MSEDLMRGEESVHRNNETFNTESEFKNNISVSEDRPLQMNQKLSMTEFYLSQKNGRNFYNEIKQQDQPINILTKSISFVKEQAELMEEQRTSPKRYDTVKHKVPSHIVVPSPKKESESDLSPSAKKKFEAVSERIKRREEEIRQQEIEMDKLRE